METWSILRVLVLLTAANAAPVLARDLLRNRLAIPIDGGAKFADGRPIFGTSKTFRGVMAAAVATTICAPLLGMGWDIGLRVGIAAMAGDLASSFVKRRLNVPSGGRATGLDQLPESLLPVLACWRALSLSFLDAIIICAVFMLGEMAISPLLYRLRLRERPY
jgi:CDP-diglyceride synthetase